MKRTAKAQWQGSLKEGKGNISTQSEILNQTNYSFRTRFVGDEKGTNPEKLLAAAHVGCFTMAVSYASTEKGISPTLLNTQAVVSMGNAGITGVHLTITGEVPGISADAFEVIAKEAERNCLISKVLNIAITSTAVLHS